MARNRIPRLDFSENEIPYDVMRAPIIPGLNSMEIPHLLKAASENGASTVGYTMVRLNGSIRPFLKIGWKRISQMQKKK